MAEGSRYDRSREPRGAAAVNRLSAPKPESRLRVGRIARRRCTMSDPKQPPHEEISGTPAVDERANEAFLDTIFDTDGRPNRDAVDLVEIEGEDLEDEP